MSANTPDSNSKRASLAVDPNHRTFPVQKDAEADGDVLFPLIHLCGDVFGNCANLQEGFKSLVTYLPQTKIALYTAKEFESVKNNTPQPRRHFRPPNKSRGATRSRSSWPWP